MTPLAIILLTLAVAAAAFYAGAQWRKDYNRDLYLDEQHKRNTAENELAEKREELISAWIMIRTCDQDALIRERVINGLIGEVADLQRALWRTGTVPGTQQKPALTVVQK